MSISDLRTQFEDAQTNLSEAEESVDEARRRQLSCAQELADAQSALNDAEQQLRATEANFATAQAAQDASIAAEQQCGGQVATANQEFQAKQQAGEVNALAAAEAALNQARIEFARLKNESEEATVRTARADNDRAGARQLVQRAQQAFAVAMNNEASARDQVARTENNLAAAREHAEKTLAELSAAEIANQPASEAYNVVVRSFEELVLRELKPLPLYETGGRGDCGPFVASAFINWEIETGKKGLEIFHPSLIDSQQRVTQESVRSAVAQHRGLQPKQGVYWETEDWEALAELLPYNLAILRITHDNDQREGVDSIMCIPCKKSEALDGSLIEETPLPLTDDERSRLGWLALPCMFAVNNDWPGEHYLLALKNEDRQHFKLANGWPIHRVANSVSSWLHQNARPKSSHAGIPPAAASASAPVTPAVQASAYSGASWLANSTSPLGCFLQQTQEIRNPNGRTDWRQISTFHHMLSLCARIVEASTADSTSNPTMKKKFPHILVVGDQSAGKTSIIIPLTGQVLFTVDPKTGTIVRTALSMRYRKDAPLSCSVVYPGHNLVDLDGSAVKQWYAQQFGNGKQGDRLDIGRGPICEVIIESPDPTVSLSVIDHPGFVLKYKEDTTATSEQSITEFIDGGGAGILLVVQAINQNPDAAGFLNLKMLPTIPRGQIVLAVNKLDMLSEKDWAQLMRQAFNTPAGEPLKRTPLQILDFIKKTMLDARKQHICLPPYTEVFFCASSGQLLSDLGNDPIAAYHTFMNQVPNGQIDNERVGREKLLNAAEWLRWQVELVPMTPSEEAEFESRLGLKKLFACLLKKQASAAKATVDAALQQVTRKLEHAEQQLIQATSVLTQPKTMADVILCFIEQVPQIYRTLASEQPYAGVKKERSAYKEASSEEKGNQFSKLDIRESYLRLKEGGGLGFTLKDVDRLIADLGDQFEFPPPEFRPPDYAELVNRHLPRMVRSAEKKVHSLSTLLLREQTFYAFIASFIRVDHIDHDSVFAEAKAFGGVDANTLTNAVAHYIAEKFDKLLGKNGSRYIACRTATQFLLQAQAVIQVLHGVPYFECLFHSPSQVMAVRKAKHQYEAMDDSDPDKESARLQYEAVLVEQMSTTPQLMSFVSRLSANVPQKSSPLPDHVPNVSNNYGKWFSADDFVEISLLRFHEARSESLNEDPASPISDLVWAMIAQYFDKPFEQVFEEQTSGTTSLELCQPSFFPMLLSLAPLFLESDPIALRNFATRHPREDVSVAILKCLFPEEQSQTPQPKKSVRSSLGHLAIDAALNFMASELPSDVRASVVRSTKNFITAQSHSEPASSYTFKPLEYHDPSERAFSSLTPSQRDLMMAIIVRPKDNAVERAQLMTDVLKTNTTMDIMHLTALKDGLGKTEEQHLEYSVHRFISSGMFLSLLGVLTNVSSIQYPYTHSITTDEQVLELYERVLSILAGYQYPFTRENRPACQEYLNPVRVVEFLYRQIARLRSAIDRLQKNNFDVEEDSSQRPPWPVDQDSALSAEHMLFHRSPIVQQVIRLLFSNSSDAQVQSEIFAKLTSWYTDSRGCDIVSRRSFTAKLIHFLATSKYDSTAHTDILLANVALLTKEVKSLREIELQMRKLRKLLDTTVIVDGMLQAVLHENSDLDSLQLRHPIPPEAVISAAELIRISQSDVRGSLKPAQHSPLDKSKLSDSARKLLDQF